MPLVLPRGPRAAPLPLVLWTTRRITLEALVIFLCGACGHACPTRLFRSGDGAPLFLWGKGVHISHRLQRLHFTQHSKPAECRVRIISTALHALVVVEEGCHLQISQRASW